VVVGTADTYAHEDRRFAIGTEKWRDQRSPATDLSCYPPGVVVGV